ncbi:uncharacterized protein LOC132402556 [Hypanus sabinus]|uniref:uncharacterized protein LOC132402556 n=1 Tax=Hypanus sabinus TaxID=79690 RepID=UPI0028C3C2DE|nr:uncharacterized protein LOC132402556 [Hypanus sabinus]XP_059841409.1 uncharacterized protein LOC132402556 [Hypanus sabinus]XP_059841410.1 uncharacterized protein LOC132402556 [Hypanus sabinus]XP_059841411.1 uncharacterized protein LOC132402556 [Hypanus sabinus]
MEEDVERVFEERALPHLLQSLGALLNVVQTALSSPAGGQELDVDRIQQEVELASKGAKLAVDQAQEASEKMDIACEKATAQYGQLSVQRREKGAALQELQAKVRQMESEKELATSRLQAATASLRQAEDALRSARAKAGEKQTGRDVGIGLSFLLPCVGIPMAVAFEKERQLSKSEVELASDDRSQLRYSVSKDEQLLERLGGELPELQAKAQQLEIELGEIGGAERELKELRGQLSDAQARLRASFHQLSSLQGKVGTLSLQCQNLYSLRPLLPPLEEAILQSLMLPPQPPFTQASLQRLTGDLKALQPQLKNLHLSQDSDEYLK